MTDKAKDQGNKGGVDAGKIKIDDADRVQSEQSGQTELTNEQLDRVAGGMATKKPPCKKAA